MTPEEYERRPEVKAALKLVRSLPALLRSSGWASYANRLMDALGVPPGERKYEGGWEMPLEFQYAYKRAVAKWTKADVFNLVILPRIKSGEARLSGRLERLIDGKMVLYHGTSADWLRKIEVEGLRAPVYLSNDYETALLFGQKTACPMYTPVILEVGVPDASLLRADLNMYEMPTEKLIKRYGVEIYSDLWRVVHEGRLRGPRDEFDWESSLTEVGSVFYDGNIEQSEVLRVHWGYCKP